MDLFELLGKISIENAEANEALDETSEKGEKTQSKLSKAFSAVGKGAVAVGKTVATGLAAGATAMGALTVKALNLSGELEQNMGGSEQVFKESAGKMQETAKDAFANMGLSTSEFLGTANKMGALFQGAGFGIEESADLSASAMQRAADVASIMGIDTASAMEAIAGAAKGNFTMMDNLGVAMNDTAIQNYALSKGIEKSTSEMTQQEKIGLAMEMFMDKTAYAAGNYAKENATLAGSLGTAKAALTNFLDGSGDVDSLVGAFKNAAEVIVNNITEIAPRLISGITEIVNKIIPMLPPLLQKLLPVIIEGAVSLINGLVAALPTLIDALMGALPGLIAGFTQIVNALIAALPQIMQSLVSALPTLLPLLIDGLVSMIVMLCNTLPQIIQPIIDYLPDIIIAVVNALMNNLPALIRGIIALVLGIVKAIPQIISGLIDALPTVIQSILEGIIAAFPVLLEGVLQLVAGLFQSIFGLSDKEMSQLGNFFKSAWNAIKNVVSNVVNAIKNVVSNVWNGIKNVTSNVWNGIKNGVSNAINAVKNTVSNVFNGIKNTVTNIWNGIMNAIKKPIEKARDLVKGAIDKIKGFFSFKFEWPKIKMPHFSITPPGWKFSDLFEGSFPKLGVEWYAKGGVLNKPTLFDYNPATGTAKVGGEKGEEAVAPIDVLQGYIRAAVQSENAVVAVRLERIIELLVAFFPDALDRMNQSMVLDTGVLVAETASAFDAELGRIAIRKGRGR